MVDENNKSSFDDVIGSKWLSMLLVCRNDNYMGNYKYRLATSLNYLARNLKSIGRLDRVEILVTDWNSDIPVAKVLPLSREAWQLTRFVCVPPLVAAEVQQPDQVFHSSCAMNTALRRAKGEFLMMIDADTLLPYHSLRSLCELLDGKIPLPFSLNRCFFLGNRRHVPWEIVQREPTLEEWHRYLLLTGGELPRDEDWPGLGVCQIAWLAHRSIWHTSRGFNQQLHYWGWNDAELTLRITQHYPWINLESIGVSLFHMEHWPHNRRSTPKLHNTHSVSSTFTVNDENWGLGNYELEIQKGENICEFIEVFDLSRTAGSVVKWGKTREQLLTEVTGRTVRQHIEALSQLVKLDSFELDSLKALAWYSLYHCPRTYIEFGISSGYAAAVVAAACPSVEIYGIDSWQTSNEQSPPPPDYATGMLRDIEYRGYTRLVTGETQTAFRRLRDSSIGQLSFDLALVRGEMLGADTIGQLNELILHVAPGGAIVFTHIDNAAFQALWSQMQQDFPQYTYLKLSPNTGIVLASDLQRSDLDEVSDPKFSIESAQGDNDVMPIFLKESLTWKTLQLERVQEQMQTTQVELEQSREIIRAMETSKFWKMRTAWFRLKLAIGLRGD